MGNFWRKLWLGGETEDKRLGLVKGVIETGVAIAGTAIASFVGGKILKAQLSECEEVALPNGDEAEPIEVEVESDEPEKDEEEETK